MSTESLEVPTEILIAEYQATQDSAQHHANMSWTATNILWASSLVLLGFTLNNIGDCDKLLLLTALSVIGLVLSLFVFFIDRQLDSVMKKKYERCKELELKLGMKQHSELRSRHHAIKHFYRVMPFIFALAWSLVIFSAWTMPNRVAEGLKPSAPTTPCMRVMINNHTFSYIHR